MSADLLNDSLYYRLFDSAERVRWKMSDIPWHEIDAARIDSSLVAIVRQIACSELTTFDAVRQFYERGYVDDPDFGQWIAVWLYEETKHPQVLMKWLSCCGEKFSTEFMLEGRTTQPFLRSPMSTLVMNVISEMMASAGYLNLAKASPEPVLAQIALHLAADEGRHGSHFMAYAQRHIDRSENPDLERKRAVEVLYYWLLKRKSLQHPIGLLVERFENDPSFSAFYDEMGFDDAHLVRRICAAIGSLVGVPMTEKEQIKRTLKELREAARQAATS